MTDLEGQGKLWFSSDTPVKAVYAKEVEKLLADCLGTSFKRFYPPAQGILRAPTADKNVATVVHCDFGLSLEMYSEVPRFSFGEQIEEMKQTTDATGYMLINLWRPVLPMAKPLRWKPLCVCDPQSVSLDDMVTVEAPPEGSSTLLKAQPGHRWYFYPDMTTDEVLVFKQYHYVKGETEGRVPVFHTACTDPAEKKGIERRCSFEYRVGALLQ